MNYYLDQLKTAIEDFKRNKTRTFLASLGILIGVLSVVMLIALGLGLKNYIKGRFEDLGVNLIIIMPGSGLSQGVSGFGSGLLGGTKFDERDVVNLGRIDNVEYVVPIFIKSVVIETGNEEEIGYIYGTDGDVFKSMNMKALAGKFPSSSDMQRRLKDVVVGYELAKSLFSVPEEGEGKILRINNQRFKVVGVAAKTRDRQIDMSVIMSYKTTFGSLNPDKTFFSIYLGVKNDKDVPGVKSEIQRLLEERYDEKNFSVSDQNELLDVVNRIFNILNSVLIAIGSISLIVGGIGIMNIMYANVTERTKEIGIRRAIGATKKDILFQFVAEAVMLSVFGGLLALLLASIIVIGVRPFFPIALNGLAIVAAIGISTFIGVFFGVFPARRASNLTPIEAIRYE